MTKRVEVYRVHVILFWHMRTQSLDYLRSTCLTWGFVSFLLLTCIDILTHCGLQLVTFFCFILQVGYSTQSRQFSGLVTYRWSINH